MELTDETGTRRRKKAGRPMSAFVSSKFNSAQTSFSTTHRKALAVVWFTINIMDLIKLNGDQFKKSYRAYKKNIEKGRKR
jgi:hypothetical protein